MYVEVVNEFFDGNVAAVEILVITPDGHEFIAKGSSRRDPIDKPNRDVAMNLAMGRALTSAANKISKRAEGLVRQADNLRDEKNLRESEATSQRLMNLASTDVRREPYQSLYMKSKDLRFKNQRNYR